MSFFPDITPLTNKIQEFTASQAQSQQAIIALLKQNNLLLTQLLQKIETK